MAKPRDPFYGHTPFSVLIVRMSALGDILFTLPAVLALKRAYPKTLFYWLLDRKYAELVEPIDGVDHVIPFDRPALTRDLRTLDWFWRAMGIIWGYVRLLRDLKFTYAIVFQPLLRAGLAAYLSGARLILGSKGWNEGAWIFYNHRKKVDRKRHVVEQHMMLIDGTRADSTPQRPDLQLRDRDFAKVRGFRKDYKLAKGGYAVVYPGASRVAKQWTVEAYAELADRLSREHKLVPVLAWGWHEEALAKEILGTMNEKGFLAPETGQRELAALLADARLVVAPDTGPLHLANIVGTPVVGLYGPTDPEVWRPYWQPSRVVRAETAMTLSTRQMRKLKRPAPSMDDISVEVVAKACAELLFETAQQGEQPA